MTLNLQLPRIRKNALAVWGRNLLVWRRLLGSSVAVNLGEPLLYLLGLGYGLGMFIGEMAGMNYLTFVASGIVASSAMNTATFEGMYSVFTRMVPQRTYEGMLCTPLEIDDIIAGEMLWCASKSLMASASILIVATALGAIHTWQALWVLPMALLIGLCFAGPAIVMSAISRGYDFFSYYFTFLITPMFIFSGVFYPVSALPEFFQSFVWIMPLAHAIAIVRPLIADTTVTQPLLHLAVLALYALVGYYAAVVLARRRLIV